MYLDVLYFVFVLSKSGNPSHVAKAGEIAVGCRRRVLCHKTLQQVPVELVPPENFRRTKRGGCSEKQIIVYLEVDELPVLAQLWVDNCRPLWVCVLGAAFKVPWTLISSPDHFSLRGLTQDFMVVLELQKSTTGGPKCQRTWRIKGEEGWLQQTLAGREINFKSSFCILYPSFSLTLIVKLEMDSSGGKILIPRCNEMTFFFLTKLYI